MKQLPPVYLIFSSTVLGGAEKRFLELWWQLKQQGKISVFCFVNHLVMKGIEQNVFLGQIVKENSDSFLVFSIDPSLSTYQYQLALLKEIKG